MTPLRISDAAAATGIPATTLRYWEQAGLLHATRTGSGYRVFDDDDLERLRFIRAAKQLNLSLEAIAELLRTRDHDACVTVKERMRAMVSDRLAEVEMAIDDLTRLTGTLRAGLADLEALPDRRTPCDPSCASLAGSASAASETEPVLACSLVATDHGEQLARWSTLLADATVTREGLAAHLELPAIRAAEAAALVVDEQACCPFLGFRLTFTGDTVGLVITAPNPPALPFVDALLEAGDPTCR